MAIKIQLRRGTAAEWTSANPVLMQGEMGVETDTLKVKIGNGTTAWTTLPYFTQGAKGDKGDQGIQGIQGVQGNTGPVGPVGPANSLSVGSVTTGIEGSDAEVTITGTAPNQTMSLVIPRGDKGDAATITVGTVTQVAAGQPATVTNSGTSAAAVLNFEIPNAVGVPTGGSTGQVVKKTASATEWASLSTSDLGDVAIASPSNGQALTYDSGTGKWKNATPAANLAQLGDVAVSSPADKQVLQYESASGKWKNKVASGGVTVGSANPSSPIDGDGWFYAEDGTLFVRYNDGNSTQWVQPNAVLSSQIEQRYYSPNYIINGGFDIWQRGTSFSFSGVSGSYTTDRWAFYTDGTGAAVTVSQQALPAGAISGSEAGRFFIRINRTVAGSGGTYSNLQQPIEDVRTLAGKTATLSFWAKADANRTITTVLGQDFGTGGSAFTATPVQSANITTSWARYSFTFAVPSIAGKTIGSIDNKLWVYIGTPNVVSSIDIDNVQFEEGATATPFRRNANSLQGELAACQRYFQAFQGSVVGSSPPSYLAFKYFFVPSTQQMRVLPTASATSLRDSYTGGVLASNPTVNVDGQGYVWSSSGSNSSSGWNNLLGLQLSAEL